MIGVIGISSGPTWSQSSSSAIEIEKVDRFLTGSAWKRDSVKQLTTGLTLVNGSRSKSANNDLSVSNMEGNNGVDIGESDHIVSVHNNPFFKTYGIRTQRPESRIDDANVQESSVTLRSANIKENEDVFDEDDPGEYRPGSGFVFKLLGKFSSLSSAREENNYRPKRTSSLENLVEKHRRDSGNKDEEPRRMLSSLSKSVESVNHIGNNLQPLKIPTSSFSSSSDSYDKRSRHKSPRENVDTQALGREHIILIEKESDKTESKQPVSFEGAKFSGPQVISLKDEVTNSDELPKPNTVLSVRSMFEKSKPSAPMPIYSTATGPVVLSPTSNLKHPQFSLQKVSKVTPSLSTEVVTNNVSKPPSEMLEQRNKKRQAPKPPVSTLQQDQKTGLPTPRPRNKQSPVIAVAPFVNDNTTNEEGPKEVTKNSKKLNEDDNAIWPEGSVSKVFDSTAVIKPPVAPARPSRRVSGSSMSDSNNVSKSTKTEDVSKRREKPPRLEKRLDMNGTNLNSKPVDVQPETRSEPESPRVDIRYESNSKFESIFAPDIPPSDLDTHLELHKEPSSPVDILPEGDGPVKGIPRFIAERLMRDGNKTGHHQTSFVNSSSSQEETIVEVTTEVEAPLKRKRKNVAPNDEPTEPRDTTNKEILNFRKNLKRVSESKSSKVAEIFNTADIVRTVPKLDLSSITDDQRNGYYQEGYKPTVIEPCKIVFEGANVKLPRSLLAKSKKRTIKGRITFDENLTQIYEYTSEEVSLQLYFQQNPNEPEFSQDSQEGGVVFLEGFGESSDDYDEDVMTPRDSGDDEIIKSNPALSHSDAWSTYRSKYQTEEYTFGAVMNEPEPPKPETKLVEELDENNQIVPAEEDTTWSTETNSDLLF